jgi:hypothetical protein
MLLATGGMVSAGSPPAWVAEWLAERSARLEKKREKAESPPRPVDAQAQRKRQENRLERIGQGLGSLKLWLQDLVRTGLTSVPSRGYGFFDEQARRLIDAQAPGVARRVAALAGVASAGAGWQRPFLEQLASLYLLIRGFERREALPQAAHDLLLNVIGIPQAQEEILALAPIADRWQVIAQELTVEDKLRVQRTWLLGERTAQCLVILAFAHGTQPIDATLAPGFAFEGELCRYPGDPLRALVKSRQPLIPLAKIHNAVDLDTLPDQYATQRAANPWLEDFAAAITAVTFRRESDGWILVDAAGRSLPLTLDEPTAWTLLAISGGHPVETVVLHDGVRTRPMALLAEGHYVSLQRAGGEVAA